MDLEEPIWVFPSEHAARTLCSSALTFLDNEPVPTSVSDAEMIFALIETPFQALPSI